jgi:secreted PhoX family phosphatase
MSKPFEGKLQAMRVKGQRRFDTATLPRGPKLKVDWVDITVPDPSASPVHAEGQDSGAAIIRRGEGLFLAGDTVFFCATVGGPIHRGQIFALDLEKNELSVVAASEDPEELDMPDNITVSPSGQLYACEDNLGNDHLRRITPEGRAVPFARNAASNGEFAGVCFSPDERFMFVNMQEDGLTLAITGPFETERAVAVPPVPIDPAFPPGTLGLSGGLAVVAMAALSYARRRAGNMAEPREATSRDTA